MEIAIIILIVLLVGTIVTYFSGNNYASKIALTFSVIVAVLSLITLFGYNPSDSIETFSKTWLNSPRLSISFKLDGLSLLLLLLNSILLPIIIMTTISHKVKSEKLFYSLILFMSFAMAGVFLASDALLYYVFWELSLIPIFFIVILWGSGDKAELKKSAMTFFIYTFAGSLFMLASIIYLYTKAGSFLLEDFYKLNLSHTEQIWVCLGFFIAYAIKIPIFPFHTWQANVYQKAPLAGTLLLGALMSKMGLYSVIRWQLPVTPNAIESMQTAILVLCVIGVIYGSIIALRQKALKRVFAFASLAHVGMIAAGIYSLTFDGLLGAVIMILAHGFTVVGLFLSSEVIQRRLNTNIISEMGGIKSLAPHFTLGFLVIVLASINLPLTFNFVGEFTILFGLYHVNIWYTIFAGTSMFLGAFFMLRMYQQVMLGETSFKHFADLTKNETFIFVLLAVILVFFGVYSEPIVNLVKPSLNEILMYINR